MKRNTIYCGDCLDLMHDIEDRSVDMILCDLPYGTTACHWDSIIPLEPLWAHYKRIIKLRGAIVLTASQPFTSVLVMSNLGWFKYELIWNKGRGREPQLSNIRPMKSHDSILIFCNGSTLYNPQMNKLSKPDVRAKNSISGGEHNLIKNYGRRFNTIYSERYPLSILNFATQNGLHPTQKPVALFAYLIRTYTNPGELVLDNCIGSGTTAIAAIETGRDWIGIEQDRTYFELAQRRIEERLKQPFLPGILDTPAKEQAEQAALW